MSDTKTITEPDAVLREREAYIAGIRRATSATYVNAHRDAYDRESAERYPLPKIERPRVVKDPHGFGYWTVSSGNMRVRLADGAEDRFTRVVGQSPHPNCRGVQYLPIHQYVTEERAALWADLLARPTELVDSE